MRAAVFGVAVLLIVGCGTPSRSSSDASVAVDSGIAPRIGGMLPVSLAGAFHQLGPDGGGLGVNLRFDADGGWREARLGCDYISRGTGAWAELDGGVELLGEFPEAVYPTDAGLRITAITGVEPPTDWFRGGVCFMGACDGGYYAVCANPPWN
ncbi:MAG: hypothetical protein ACJ790_14405 [Myxococcaceae bacterium]